MQAPKELTLSALRRKRDFSRGFSTRGPNTPIKGAERTEADLKDYALCRRPLLASRIVISGARCLHFDILGDNVSTSGAPWGGILAPRGHPGGPWEQQDGFEMCIYRISLAFGVVFWTCVY